MPASWMRRAIHAGVGAAGSKPVTDRPVKTGQPTGSSTTTSYATSDDDGTGRSAGSVKSRP